MRCGGSACTGGIGRGEFEGRFPEVCETQPDLLAHHYMEASLNAQAIFYWQRAGQRAIERSAHAEAISSLTAALDLLTTLPAMTPAEAMESRRIHRVTGLTGDRTALVTT